MPGLLPLEIAQTFDTLQFSLGKVLTVAQSQTHRDLAQTFRKITADAAHHFDTVESTQLFNPDLTGFVSIHAGLARTHVESGDVPGALKEVRMTLGALPGQSEWMPDTLPDIPG